MNITLTVKKCLDCVQYTVHTHEGGHDVYDYQEGRGIMEVERPQLKIKMTGTINVVSESSIFKK